MIRAAHFLVFLPLAACAGPQSALAPGGLSADRILTLATTMFIGGAIIFAGVLIVLFLAMAGPKRFRDAMGKEETVFWTGVVFPIVTLSLLLLYGLAVMANPDGGAQDPSETIHVSGERWWWRIAYLDESGEVQFETANEIRLPENRTAQLLLTSPDVIHSIWIPPLGGKVDLIPGRQNELTLTPRKTGVFRGQCAEYCGGAHALMALDVIVMTEDEFDAWRANMQTPPASPETPLAREGRDLFLDAGCPACHAIRGTPANGRVGPDLTNLGQRLTIGAGTLPNTDEARRLWIAANQHVKPSNNMPPFVFLTERQLYAISAYLGGLKEERG